IVLVRFLRILPKETANKKVFRIASPSLARASPPIDAPRTLAATSMRPGSSPKARKDAKLIPIHRESCCCPTRSFQPEDQAGRHVVEGQSREMKGTRRTSLTTNNDFALLTLQFSLCTHSRDHVICRGHEIA